MKPIKKTGRKPALSAEAGKAAMEMLASKQYRGAQEVAQQLHLKGFTSTQVQPSTLIKHARAAAHVAGTKLWLDRGKPKKAIAPRTQTKRLSFANSNKSTAWRAVMFTDRKKFHLQYPGSKIHMVRWGLGKTKAEARQAVQQPNHPVCVNIYAGITRHAVTDVHIVAGTTSYTSEHKNKQGQKARNITASEYRQVLMDTILPWGTKLFRNVGVSSWWMQQDNDPSHKGAAEIIAEYNQANGTCVRLLPNWPPSSPDLSLIENVWAYVQGKVNEKGCANMQEFEAEVKAQFKAVPRHMLANLYASMPKRLQQVIELGGGKTKY